MNMNAFANTNEQLGEFSKSTIDAAMKFAQVGLSSAEHLFALNVEAVKVGFDVTSKNAKAVTSVKDAEGMNALRTNAAETGMEFMMGYSKNFYAATSAAQAQYSALVEERMSLFQQSMGDTIDKLAKNAPAGSEAFVTAMKNGLAASATATDNMSKAAKQAGILADTAFKNVTETAEKATKPAAKRK